MFNWNKFIIVIQKNLETLGSKQLTGFCLPAYVASFKKKYYMELDRGKQTVTFFFDRLR